MTEITYREGLNLGLRDAMEADADVIVLGEDVAAAGGAFKVTDGLLGAFGPQRVLDTPISEQAIIGAAIGAAVEGLRPVAEIMFADFAATCFDGIANELPKYRYMTGGQVSVPVVVRMANGAGGGFAAQHSQSVENWFLNVPGLKVAVPGTPADAYGLLRAAIEDPDPVLFFEHKGLYNSRGAADTLEAVPFGRAATVRQGSDLTIVASQLMRHRAIEAAEELSASGIEATVIDPRTIVPFDLEAVLSSLEATNRLVVAQECPAAGSWGASLVAQVTGAAFELLDAPPGLLSAKDTPVPYARNLELSWLPSVADIEAVCRATAAY